MKESLDRERQAFLAMSPYELRAYFETLWGEDKKDERARVINKIVSDPVLLAHVSYWEKWIKKVPIQKEIDRAAIASLNERESKAPSRLPLGLEKRFPDEFDRRLIARSTNAIQFSFGCSGNCPKCVWDAVPIIDDRKESQEHFPFEQIESFLKENGSDMRKNKPLPYWATDPTDYVSVGHDGSRKTYIDVDRLFKKCAGYLPCFVTKARTPDDGRWREWLDQVVAAALARGNSEAVAISVYGMKNEVVDEIEARIKSAVAGHRTFIHFTGAGKEQRLAGGLASFKGHDDMLYLHGFRFGLTSADGVLLTPRGLYNEVVVPIGEAREDPRTSRYPQGLMVVPIESIGRRKPHVGESLATHMRYGVIESSRKMNEKSWCPCRAGICKDVIFCNKAGAFRIVIDPYGIIREVRKISI